MYDLAARQFDGSALADNEATTAVAAPDSPPPTGLFRLHYDGGARGNPGPSGCGAVLQVVREGSSTVVGAAASFLGTSTNPVAEYNGLLEGLKAARARNITRLTIYGDSDLIRRQLQGDAKVGATLRHLHSAAMAQLDQLEYYVCLHVRRQWNKAADALANLAMTNRRSYQGKTSMLPPNMQAILKDTTLADALWAPPVSEPARLDYARLYGPSQRRVEAQRQGHSERSRPP